MTTESTRVVLAAWIEQIPAHELSAFHHALRLSAKYPELPEDEQTELTRLADACWNEITRRSEERYG